MYSHLKYTFSILGLGFRFEGLDRWVLGTWMNTFVGICSHMKYTLSVLGFRV